MIVDGFELTILGEQSHQSVLVDEYKIDFLYNSLIDRWFVSFYFKDELLVGGVKIIPNQNLVSNFDLGFEFVVLYDKYNIGIDDLVEAKVIFIPLENR